MLATRISASAPKATEIIVTLEIKAVILLVFIALTLCSLRLRSSTGCFSDQLTRPSLLSSDFQLLEWGNYSNTLLDPTYCYNVRLSDTSELISFSFHSQLEVA